MREEIPVKCPGCQLQFKVPVHLLGKRARCNDCQTIFALEAPSELLEDTVAEWLLEGAPPAKAAAGAGSVPAAAVAATPTEAQAPKPAPSAPLRAGSAGLEPVRLERIDEMGAYFEFPADQLPDVALRGSFARKCISCAAKSDLQVHLLVWTDRLPPKDQIRLQETETRTLGPLAKYEGQSVEEFLGRLPVIRSLSAPYNLPFPYYVCGNCSAVGEVLTHVLAHGPREYCQIMIANLEIAADFLASNGGAKSEDYPLILEAWQHQKGDPWRALPLAVRNRLGHWYQKKANERFVEYFPDAEFARTELGTAGTVLTNRRAIYKKFAAQREFDLDKPANLRCTAGAQTWHVEVSQTGAKQALLTLTPQTGARFVQQCRALWAGVHVAERVEVPDSAPAK